MYHNMHLLQLCVWSLHNHLSMYIVSLFCCLAASMSTLNWLKSCEGLNTKLSQYSYSNMLSIIVTCRAVHNYFLAVCNSVGAKGEMVDPPSTITASSSTSLLPIEEHTLANLCTLLSKKKRFWYNIPQLGLWAWVSQLICMRHVFATARAPIARSEELYKRSEVC